MIVEWPIGPTLDEIEQRALLLIAFADGQEEAGFVVSARRMRTVARDTVELVQRVRDHERQLGRTVVDRERESA